jgi:DNA/RNA-binding domain of Phe-tRNA-synthetase-like protein
MPWFRKPHAARGPQISVADPRFEDYETVSTFEDQTTALAWRDELRNMGIDANCTADELPDRFGRGDIYLVVPPDQWSRANEIVDNLDF